MSMNDYEKQFGNPVNVGGKTFVGVSEWTTVPSELLLYGFLVCPVAKNKDWRTALWLSGQHGKAAIYVLEEWEAFRLANLLDSSWLDSMEKSSDISRTMSTEAGNTFEVSVDPNDFVVELEVDGMGISIGSNCVGLASKLRLVSCEAACHSTH